MAPKTINVEVESATYDVASALGKTVTDIVAALKTNPNVANNVVLIASAVITDLAPVISEFTQLPADAQDSLPDFLMAWTVAGINVWKGLSQ